MGTLAAGRDARRDLVLRRTWRRSGLAGGRSRFRRRLYGLLDPGDRAGDAVKALFKGGDAGEQPFAVGGEHAHGFGQPPAFAGVERAERLGA